MVFVWARRPGGEGGGGAGILHLLAVVIYRAGVQRCIRPTLNSQRSYSLVPYSAAVSRHSEQGDIYPPPLCPRASGPIAPTFSPPPRARYLGHDGPPFGMKPGMVECPDSPVKLAVSPLDVSGAAEACRVPQGELLVA